MPSSGASAKASRRWATAASRPQSYTCQHGYAVTVDVQAEAVSAVEFDAVVVPGGYAPDMMRR